MSDRLKRLFCLAALLLAGALMGCAAESEMKPAKDTPMLVEITAFNVGKADAILVRVGEKTYLIDAGLKKGFSDLLYALEGEGVTRLDGVFLTHVDKDHGGGMEPLADTDIAIDAFYASPHFFKRSLKENQIVRAADQRGKDVIWLNEGDAVEIAPDCRFEVLGPLGLDPDNENNNSLVMMLVTPQGRALLAGDMEKEAEKLLLALDIDLSAAYLKVGHHGRNDATSKAFARAVSPEIAVISTDSVEEPRSANEKVIDRLEDVGARVYVTEDYERGVTVRLEGGHAVYVEQ